MATRKDGGLVSRAVREALGTLVSPQVYAQLVTRSLHASGLPEIPESGRALVDWIQGALNREIETAVGADAAELVAAQLAPIVAFATAAAAQPEPTSEPRRAAFGSDQPTGVVNAARARQPRPDLARTARVKLTREQMDKLQSADAGHTSRPQASDPVAREERAAALVLAASAHQPAIDALRSYLAGTAEVVPVVDLVGLLDTLEGGQLLSPIVLLDCQRPTVHVTSIAAIGEDLPRGTTIVLWGASDETWNQLDRERVPSCRWVRCSHEADTDDVGSLCAMLIGAAQR